MASFNTIAAVDLGSNSFRLQVARVSGGQIYPLDSFKETVRLAAGLTSEKLLEAEAQERALACLDKFAERLRGLPQQAVRAVGTNTLRVAKNAPEFLKRAQKRLGFPIEIVAGHEEARLIYLGVAHSLPALTGRRMVVDIGGGSTEFIIGEGFEPLRLESLYIGCVSMSRNYFADGRISEKRLDEAQLAAATELQTLSRTFARAAWSDAVGSSGTAKAIAECLEFNGWGEGGISAEGLVRLRKALLKAGDTRRLDSLGVKEDRRPVFPGGVAIMSAVFRELEIEAMHSTEAGMREGILWDMLGRMQHHDARESTVEEFMRRYHVDRGQCQRVERLSVAFYRLLSGGNGDEAMQQLLAWAARLHEIGISIAFSGYHRHSAYILENADMPGFSRGEQTRMAHIVLGQRGTLAKAMPKLVDQDEWLPVLALRLAVVFYRGRAEVRLPKLSFERSETDFRLRVDAAWLERNPLTSAALEAEKKNWRNAGFGLELEPVSESASRAINS